MTLVADASRVDPQNPWPWLDPFTERASSAFGGRDDDTRALLRAVMAAPVCVLFGRSGLGKTSLLLAGLFPELRSRHLLPVAVRRLEYGAAAAALSAQLHRALDGGVQQADLHWSGSAPPAAPASVAALWEQLHDRTRPLVDGAGHRWTPVFVLDQFEEVFTLELDEARRRQIFEELGDLLENRVPPSVAQRLDAEPPLLDRIDLDSQPYRVLVSLREDFLPELEHWADLIPRLGSNRYRLLPLSERHAHEAILKTGGALVNASSAEQIVQFLGRHASKGVRPRDERRIEPALLSLVCASLNADRLAKQPPAAQLDVDNLEARGSQILDRFYDDAFAGVEQDVRAAAVQWVEENLITAGGLRRPFPAEAVDRALLPAIRVLERRRLLRTEPTEQGDQIELVHDRLAGVAWQRATVRQRRTEEAARLVHEKEAAERELLRQQAAMATLAHERAEAEQARAEEAVRASRRLRLIAAVAMVLTIAAATMAVVAVRSQRAAEQARARADEATAAAQAQTAAALQSAEAYRKLAEAYEDARRAATAARQGDQGAATALLARADRSYSTSRSETAGLQLESCPAGRRVYPHLAQGADPAALAPLGAALREAGFIVPPVELVARTQLPNQSAVRYFRRNESDGAEAAAAALRRAGLDDVEARFVPGYENSTRMRPCHYELWIPAGRG